MARISEGGWAAGKALLDATTTRWPNATVLRQSSLNRAANRLQAEHATGALAVLEEVTRRFPTSANGWEKLAEAYEKQGAADKAKQAVKQGLAALAEDGDLSSNARGAIERSLKGRQQRLSR